MKPVKNFIFEVAKVTLYRGVAKDTFWLGRKSIARSYSRVAANQRTQQAPEISVEKA